MTHQEKFAMIDLGSNSFYMAIFQSGTKPIAIKHQKSKVQLRRGLSENGTLTDTTRTEALACLQAFATTLKAYSVSKLNVVGTYTFRKLVAHEPFLHDAEKILGQAITILSGEEEARLIFVGASDNLPRNVTRLFVDIGGGSTELTIGNNNNITISKSLEMGCVSFQQHFFANNNLNKKTFDKAIETAKKHLTPFIETYNRQHWQQAIGSSGTVVSIVNIIHPKHKNRTVSYDHLLWLKQKLENLEHVDQIKFTGLRRDRENILPGGLCILIALFQCFDISEITLATGGLREGLVYEFTQRPGHTGKLR